MRDNEQRRPEAEADGFTVTGHRLELYGYCRECRREK